MLKLTLGLAFFARAGAYVPPRPPSSRRSVSTPRASLSEGAVAAREIAPALSAHLAAAASGAVAPSRARLEQLLEILALEGAAPMAPPGAEREPDAYFPLSQTCFFSLALPRYSSVDICAEKLRYAITHAHLMDADFLLRQADGWEAMSP